MPQMQKQDKGTKKPDQLPQGDAGGFSFIEDDDMPEHRTSHQPAIRKPMLKNHCVRMILCLIFHNQIPRQVLQWTNPLILLRRKAEPPFYARYLLKSHHR